MVFVPSEIETQFDGTGYFADPEHPQDVSAFDLVTGRRWRAVTTGARIRSIDVIPSARRIVIVDDHGAVLVYDVDAHRALKCDVSPPGDG